MQKKCINGIKKVIHILSTKLSTKKGHLSTKKYELSTMQNYVDNFIHNMWISLKKEEKTGVIHKIEHEKIATMWITEPYWG
jgi:hypothetical protein